MRFRHIDLYVSENYFSRTIDSIPYSIRARQSTPVVYRTIMYKAGSYVIAYGLGDLLERH